MCHPLKGSCATPRKGHVPPLENGKRNAYATPRNDVVVSQVHILPVVDPLSSTQCYHCDQLNFPQCLSTPVTCHDHEVCSITYTATETHIKCQREADCARETAHPSGICPHGGYQVHAGHCEQCCNTSACVSNLIGAIQTTYNTGVICPGSCSASSASSCLTSGTHCAENQFCELNQDGHLTITGTCKNSHDLQKCIDDKARHPCTDLAAHEDLQLIVF
ncbi:hypothetical protein Btru_004206 [Bulinus truncatus]|nr:hypothetical protein Btru_004206 [Bulinus truncatus]